MDRRIQNFIHEKAEKKMYDLIHLSLMPIAYTLWLFVYYSIVLRCMLHQPTTHPSNRPTH